LNERKIMKTVNMLVGVCMALAASHALAQSALNDANRKSMAVIVEEGNKCVSGMEAEDLRPFLNPSPAVKDLLLTDAAKLRSSEVLGKLNDQERKVVEELLRTSVSCRVHLQNLEVLSADLATKEAAIDSDATAKQMLASVGQISERVMATLQAATQASPELAHFLHVQGLAN